MNITIKITSLPMGDLELVAAAALIIQHPGLPLSVKARALRDLTSFSAQLGQFESGSFTRHTNRTPVIKPPLDPEPGFDQEHRLVWRTGPAIPPSPVEAIPARSAGGSGAPAEVPPPAPTQPAEPTIPPRTGILARLHRFLFE